MSDFWLLAYLSYCYAVRLAIGYWQNTASQFCSLYCHCLQNETRCRKPETVLQATLWPHSYYAV